MLWTTDTCLHIIFMSIIESWPWTWSIFNAVVSSAFEKIMQFTLKLCKATARIYSVGSWSFIMQLWNHPSSDLNACKVTSRTHDLTVIARICWCIWHVDHWPRLSSSPLHYWVESQPLRGDWRLLQYAELFVSTVQKINNGCLVNCYESNMYAGVIVVMIDSSLKIGTEISYSQITKNWRFAQKTGDERNNKQLHWIPCSWRKENVPTIVVLQMTTSQISNSFCECQIYVGHGDVSS